METKDFNRERNATRQSLHNAEAGLDYCLEVFGDELAKRHSYDGIDGIEAARLYLLLKHHWLPRDVMSMSTTELRFALHVEMQGWTLPTEARL
jgi:hypothetical protein